MQQEKEKTTILNRNPIKIVTFAEKLRGRNEYFSLSACF